jgi:hypothetical protein
VQREIGGYIGTESSFEAVCQEVNDEAAPIYIEVPPFSILGTVEEGERLILRFLFYTFFADIHRIRRNT